MKLDICIKKKLGDFHLDIDYHGDIDTLGILGSSGCGKSMVLKCIAGIVRPDEGRIALNDKVLFDSEKRIEVKPQDRRVGYLFQNYALFPNMTVRQNIMAALKTDRAKKEEIADRMIVSFHLEGLSDHLPMQLSGGQQQRAALARMMAVEPELILLDEPFSALDVFLKDRLIRELMVQLEKYDAPVIMVSHDRDEIYRICRKTAVMDEGTFIRTDDTRRVFEAPEYKKAALLTGCKNILEFERRADGSLYLPDWDAELVFSGKDRIPEYATAIGIRAHDLIPVWEEKAEGLIGVEISHVSQLQFERQYYLKPPGKTPDRDRELRWFVHREALDEIDKKGMPGYLAIPMEKVMWLR